MVMDRILMFGYLYTVWVLINNSIDCDDLRMFVALMSPNNDRHS
jgi:hypothetical protein